MGQSQAEATGSLLLRAKLSLWHVTGSNHGYRPDACSSCQLAKDTLAELESCCVNVWEVKP